MDSSGCWSRWMGPAGQIPCSTNHACQTPQHHWALNWAIICSTESIFSFILNSVILYPEGDRWEQQQSRAQSISEVKKLAQGYRRTIVKLRGRGRGKEEGDTTREKKTRNKCRQASVLTENWWNVTNDNKPEKEWGGERGVKLKEDEVTINYSDHP